MCPIEVVSESLIEARKQFPVRVESDPD